MIVQVQVNYIRSTSRLVLLVYSERSTACFAIVVVGAYLCSNNDSNSNSNNSSCS